MEIYKKGGHFNKINGPLSLHRGTW